MCSTAFTLFGTAIGCCALAWNERGVVGVQLPEADEQATRRRVEERFPDAQEARPPADIAEIREAIVALLRGEKVELASVALDLAAVPAFHRRVYAAARAILPGETLSYGALASRIGAEGAARAVGQALGRNPFPILVPCHRVLAASGKLGGFSAHGGIDTKRRLLAIEGAAPFALSLFEARDRPARAKPVQRRVDSGAHRTARSVGTTASR
jgi:methylated-DNA-[protein]-cysteine S-methyltransferase